MASRRLLGSAYQGLRSARRQAVTMARTADLPIPYGSPNGSFGSSRFLCTQKKGPDSDTDLREIIKQRVLSGLQEAFANSDGSVPKLSIVKAGVNAALVESLKQFRIIDDHAEMDSVKDFVEGLENFLQFKESNLSVSESGDHGDGSGDPGFGFCSSALPNDSANAYVDPCHRAFMRYIAHCVSKSVEEGFEGAVKKKLQPEDANPIDNDEEGDKDWTFTEARFAWLNRRYRIWEEKEAQKRRAQHANYTRLMNEKAARKEEARKEERMEQIKEGVVELKNALGKVGERVDDGFEKSQEASDQSYELDLLNSQTLLFVLDVLEDMSKDLGYLMFKDAQEAKRLQAETLWVYTLLDKIFARLPFNPTFQLKSIVKQFDESRSLYPVLGFLFVFSSSSFTPMEWVEIGRISHDDWVTKWTEKLKLAHERAKVQK